MAEQIIWKEEIRKLSELKPYPDNPRRISKIEFEKLKDRIQRLGYHNRIKVNADNMMSGGHQKYKALQQLGWHNVQVLVPSRQLTPEEFKEIVITDNTTSGEWDKDILANVFEVPQLIEWGIDEYEVSAFEDEIIESKPKKESLPGNICATCPYKEKEK